MKYIYTLLALSWGLLLAGQAGAQAVTGAGSSAAAPIYRSWAKAYTKATGASVAAGKLASTKPASSSTNT